MISPESLKLLRCPLDPTSELSQDENHLICQRCELRFPVRDGFPTMIVEESVLPAGCASLEQLPCRIDKKE